MVKVFLGWQGCSLKFHYYEHVSDFLHAASTPGHTPPPGIEAQDHNVAYHQMVQSGSHRILGKCKKSPKLTHL